MCDSAVIRVDSLVMAGASVAVHTPVGIGCILNLNSVADHDCSMADFSDLGVGCVMACTTAHGEGAWLRAGVGVSYGTVVTAWLILDRRVNYKEFE